MSECVIRDLKDLIGSNASFGILSMDLDNGIGREGRLLYTLPDDMKLFKSLTMGRVVVMGRKTWESLPNGALPGRSNVVVTRQNGYVAKDASVFSSLNDVIDGDSSNLGMAVIGGSEIYTASMPYLDYLIVTHIEERHGGADTFLKLPESFLEVYRSNSRADTKTNVRYHVSAYKNPLIIKFFPLRDATEAESHDMSPSEIKALFGYR